MATKSAVPETYAPPVAASTGSSIAAPAPPSLRLTFLDGLRGVAALWVMIYHLWNRFYPNLSTQHRTFDFAHHPTSLVFYATFAVVQYGYLGVGLFFVLSGFCIHYAQARQDVTQTLSVRDFAHRRFFRLYPAYIASIVISLFALGCLPLMDMVLTGKHIDLAKSMHFGDALVNAAFLQIFWPKALAFNGVYWTLVYEVQFYILYPALLLLTRRYSLKAMIFLLLAAEVVFAYHKLPIANLFIYRYFEWCLGMLAAEIAVRTKAWPSKAALLALVLAAPAAGLASTFWPPLFPLRDIFFSIGFFGIVLLAAKASAEAPSKTPALLRVLQNRWLVGAGIISYSLYLVHVPVIDLFWDGAGVLSAHHPSLAPAARVASLMCIPAALWLASYLYRTIERPFMQLRRRRPARAALAES